MGYFDEAIQARDESESLEHHGVKGQKWGVRRYQTEGGTLTPAGRARYGKAADKIERKLAKSKAAEEKAINAKTSIGRGINAYKAMTNRYQADIAADKATGDYKLFAPNKAYARQYKSMSETSANIASGLKKKAQGQEGKKHEKTMNKAVEWLSSAENQERWGVAYEAAANAPLLKKDMAYIKSLLSNGGKAPSSSGRITSTKSRIPEVLGDVALAGIPTIVAERKYKKNNSADERYDRLTKNY